jgi:hypothetical protein
LLIFCLPEAHRNQRHDCLFDGGLNSVNLLRLPAVAIVLTGAVFSFSQYGAAETLNVVSITIESDWESGYMGLGRGLANSIVTLNDDKPATSGRRPRHVRATRAIRAVARPINDVTPNALVAQTLDRTGFNVSNLGAHAGDR